VYFSANLDRHSCILEFDLVKLLYLYVDNLWSACRNATSTLLIVFDLQVYLNEHASNIQYRKSQGPS